jgi:hypothetical protein
MVLPAGAASERAKLEETRLAYNKYLHIVLPWRIILGPSNACSSQTTMGFLLRKGVIRPTRSIIAAATPSPPPRESSPRKNLSSAFDATIIPSKTR